MLNVELFYADYIPKYTFVQIFQNYLKIIALVNKHTEDKGYFTNALKKAFVKIYMFHVTMKHSDTLLYRFQRGCGYTLADLTFK